MDCPNCKRELMNNDYCQICGYMVNGNYINSNMFNQESSESSINNKRIRAYIGKNEDKILNKQTNIFAGIFGMYYIIYRKCYLIGIIELIIWIIINFFYFLYHFNLIVFLYILSFIFHRSFFNDIYLYIIKRKLKKLKNKDLDEIRKLGGTKIFLVFLCIVIMFLCLLFISWLGSYGYYDYQLPN